MTFSGQRVGVIFSWGKTNEHRTILRRGPDVKPGSTNAPCPMRNDCDVFDCCMEASMSKGEKKMVFVKGVQGYVIVEDRPEGREVAEKMVEEAAKGLLRWKKSKN